MKRLRRFIILTLVILLAAGTAGLIYYKKPAVRSVSGKSSEALKQIYKSIEIHSINSKGIAVYLDDEKYILSGSDQFLMSDGMVLLMPALSLNDLFSCSVSWESDHVLVSSLPADPADPDKTADSVSLQLTDGKYVRVAEAASALGFKYSWNSEKNAAYLSSPKSTAAKLPAKFDLRSEGRISAVRDQGSWGSCWAFAAISALESSLLPDQVWNFSEDNLVNKNGFSVDGGGDFNMALAYMLSWTGPVTEKQDEYGDGVSPDGLKAAVHVQDSVIISNRDYKQIKSLVYYYGAVESSIYSPQDSDTLSDYYNGDNAAFYCPDSRECNHDIDIIGWDDDYPKENFNTQPADDGAFICKNSWGEGFGDNGYFYISYDDPNIGIYGAAYTGVESTDNYDKIYQSDLLGWTGSTGYDSPEALFSSVYTAAGSEDLSAVGFYSTDCDTWYDIYIVHDFSSVDDLKNKEILQSGYIREKGYFTIKLGNAPQLAKGEKFAVVIDIYTKDSLHPVAMEYAENEMSADADISDGEGYMSSDGTEWTSMEKTSKCNACLKLYASSR